MVLSKALMTIGVPQMIGNFVISAGLSATTFLIMLCIAFILLGIIMDAFAMIAIIPTVLPAINVLGIDPIHMGVIFVTASAIGTMTPPAAGALFFTCAQFNIPTIEMMRGIFPFLLMMVVGLFLLTLFPQISIWLPEMVF
jgi:TRAP-type C4-dicarboxylate transport system permease large subunit